MEKGEGREEEEKLNKSFKRLFLCFLDYLQLHIITILIGHLLELQLGFVYFLEFLVNIFVNLKIKIKKKYFFV